MYGTTRMLALSNPHFGPMVRLYHVLAYNTWFMIQPLAHGETRIELRVQSFDVICDCTHRQSSIINHRDDRCS